MGGLRTGFESHRDYLGSVEQLSGQPPAEDQKADAAEIVAIARSADDAHDRVDGMYQAYYIGFSGAYTYVKNNDGTVSNYFAVSGATEEQLAATIPGTDGAIWAKAVQQSDQDFTALYNAAKT